MERSVNPEAGDAGTAAERVLEAKSVPLEEILPLRGLYRREMACQIVHDSLHRRGLTDSYLLEVEGRVAGYGSVLGLRDRPRDTVIEFFVLPTHRPGAAALFRRFVASSGARRIRAQTNDPLLAPMLQDFAVDVQREKVLFHDGATTALTSPGSVFRRVTERDRDRVFRHEVEGVGDWLIEHGGVIVATGGIATHYNEPYGDLFMEVAGPHRRRGFGSYLIQELKRTAWETGRVPCARCDPSNVASRATLRKAGLLPCGSLLTGRIPAEVRGPPG